MGRPKIQQPICIQCKQGKTHCRNLCLNCYNKFKRKIRSDSSPMKKCDCSPDCPEIVPSIRMDGTVRRFAEGHGRSGINHSNWKGGRMLYGDYWYIWKPEHPQANSKGYVAEHRLYYEEYYDCLLLPWIDLHHKDGNPKNNFDIDNLQPLTPSQHISIHKKKDTSDRFCLLCGSDKTYINPRGYKYWFRDPITKMEWLCKWCWDYRFKNK